MQQYLQLLDHILTKGTKKADRTGTGTLSTFGYQTRFDLQQGFPLLTTKKLHLKSIIHELLWIISGSTNIKYLNDNGVKIWNEWADANGDLGPVYGHQWRAWPGLVSIVPAMEAVQMPDEIFAFTSNNKKIVRESIDQLSNVVKRIKSHPDDRRLIVSAWNPADVEKMALPPCHCFFQFYTRELSIEQRGKLTKHHKVENFQHVREADFHHLLDTLGVPRRALDCQLYQRSADVFLGSPFNIASYALLTSMVAQSVGMVAGDFVYTLGDAHLYLNHLDQAKLQLSRVPRSLPTLWLNAVVSSIFDYKYEDFLIEGYDPHPHIAGAVSV